MYSSVLRAHQRLDRAAYRQLKKIVGDTDGLQLKHVLHFEGKRGPDAAKLKKGDNQPPWHLYLPGGENKDFLDSLKHHYDHLVTNLKEGNHTRIGFEASWLAHVIVDGLTPAHHFPYKDALEDLYGTSTHERKTVRSHLFVKGETARETVLKSLKLIGPKGLLTNHTAFEAGAALVILPLSLSNAKLTDKELRQVAGENLCKTFEKYAHEVQTYKMFERFIKQGWNPKLARDVRLNLAPRMVKMITLAWYSALKEATVIE